MYFKYIYIFYFYTHARAPNPTQTCVGGVLWGFGVFSVTMRVSEVFSMGFEWGSPMGMGFCPLGQSLLPASQAEGLSIFLFF